MGGPYRSYELSCDDIKKLKDFQFIAEFRAIIERDYHNQGFVKADGTKVLQKEPSFTMI